MEREETLLIVKGIKAFIMKRMYENIGRLKFISASISNSGFTIDFKYGRRIIKFTPNCERWRKLKRSQKERVSQLIFQLLSSETEEKEELCSILHVTQYDIQVYDFSSLHLLKRSVP